MPPRRTGIVATAAAVAALSLPFAGPARAESTRPPADSPPPRDRFETLDTLRACSPSEDVFA